MEFAYIYSERDILWKWMVLLVMHVLWAAILTWCLEESPSPLLIYCSRHRDTSWESKIQLSALLQAASCSSRAPGEKRESWIRMCHQAA